MAKQEIRRLEGVVGCSADEQETTIVIERGSDRMRIYSSDNTMITKLNRILEKDTEGAYEVEWTNDTGSMLNAPKGLLTLRSGVVKREMTPEQREEAANRMRELRKQQLST